ncbi:hypothetical protein ACBR40_21895 [Nonomuraea sp. AD125B]|uniref:hypothetical protein n=1 Tax=Nonomuraea sp. AD125B TaxID=3242897 RepID=UPI0035276903
MAADEAGYTGVVHSDYYAGYSTAEGYTGVVHGTTASGYTGTAPAPVTSRRSSGGARPSATASPYDEVVAEADRVGDDAGATGPAIDPGEARQAEESPSPPPLPPDDRRVTLLNELARDLVSLERQIRLSPDPEPPNAALDRARRVLGEPYTIIGSNPLVDLLGEGAEHLNRQIGEAIAQTKPGDLGVAYLQGVLQETLSTLVGAGAAMGQAMIDPSSFALRSASDLVNAIREHMAQGEAFWEAVNSVLNPMTRVLNNAWEANETAGRALEAARTGDRDRAVELAREAGRGAARAGLAVADTVTTATDAVSTGRSFLRHRRTGRSPALGTSPPPPRSEGSYEFSPRSAAHADPLTSTLRTHPIHAQVPLLDPAEVRVKRRLREGLLKTQQAEAARALESLPIERRRDPSRRLPLAKAIYNSYEELTALDLQAVYPERGYLTQVELVSVVTPTGEIPTRRINASVDVNQPGRTLDILELRPDRKFGDYELKTVESLKNSYPARGAEVSAFKKSSRLSKQISKTKAVFEQARTDGGRVRVRGRTLDGATVELLLDPDGFLGTTPMSYRQLPQ